MSNRSIPNIDPTQDQSEARMFDILLDARDILYALRGVRAQNADRAKFELYLKALQAPLTVPRCSATFPKFTP